MTKAWETTQQDLFEGSTSKAPLAPAERTKALQQLQALLIEATLMDQKDGGDDQDHA